MQETSEDVEGFTMSVAEGSPTVLRLEGELDVAAVPQFAAVVAGQDGDVELHCSGLTFFDAAGVGAFVAAHRGCAARGSKLVVVDPSPPVLRVLKLIGLDTLLTIQHNCELC